MSALVGWRAPRCAECYDMGSVFCRDRAEAQTIVYYLARQLEVRL